MDGAYPVYAATPWAGQAACDMPSLSLGQQQHQPYHEEAWSLGQPQPSPGVPAHVASSSYEFGYYQPNDPAAYMAPPGPGFGSLPLYGSEVSEYDDGSYYQGTYDAYEDDAGACTVMYNHNDGYGAAVDGHSAGRRGGGTAVSGHDGGSGTTASSSRVRPSLQPLRQPHQTFGSGGRSPSTGVGGGGAAAAAAAPSLPGAYLGRVKEGALVKRQSVEELARSAPIWVVYYNYSINGPTGQPGVLTSDQLIQAYGSRRVHGHTLLVGLAGGAQAQLTQLQWLVPAAFLRPLVFYLALAHAGVSYTPITAEDLAAGAPPPGWCLPGSVLQPRAAADAAAAAAVPAATPALPLNRWDAPEVDAGVRQLLSRAPYWCLLNNYSDSGRWSCPQNMTAAQLRDRLRAGHGCLYSCVLGTTERLANGAWIPTSMVLPLGVLLQAVGRDAAGGGGGSASRSGAGAGPGLGLEYAPPSAADVRYFIEDAVRAVQGRPEAASRLEAHLQRLEVGADSRTATAAAAAAAAAEQRLRLDPSAPAFVPSLRVTSPADVSGGGGGGGTIPEEQAEMERSDTRGDDGAWAERLSKVDTAGAGAESGGGGGASEQHVRPDADQLEAGGAGEEGGEARGSGPEQGRPQQHHHHDHKYQEQRRYGDGRGQGFAAPEQDTPLSSGAARGGTDVAAPPVLVPTPVPVLSEAGPGPKAASPGPPPGTSAQVEPRAVLPSSFPLHKQPPQLQALHQRLAEKLQQRQNEQQQPQQSQGQRPQPQPLFPPQFPPHVRPTPSVAVPSHPQQPQAQQHQHHHHQQHQQQAASGLEPPPMGVLVPIATPFLRFETAVFRLFQGDQGQHAFSSLWWYIDPTEAAAGGPGPGARVLGPYSCEQMILAYIAQLLPHQALVCGTQSTLAPSPPPPPPSAAFAPLGSLLAATEEGRPYVLLPLTAERNTPAPVAVPVAVPIAVPHPHQQTYPHAQLGSLVGVTGVAAARPSGPVGVNGMHARAHGPLAAIETAAAAAAASRTGAVEPPRPGSRG